MGSLNPRRTAAKAPCVASSGHAAVDVTLSSMSRLLSSLPLGSAAEVKAVAGRQLVYHTGMVAGLKLAGLIDADGYSSACQSLKEIAMKFVRIHTPAAGLEVRQ